MEPDDMSLFSVPMLTATERRRMLVEWNDTRAPFPADRTVARLVEGQTAATPGAPAMTCGDEHLSYAQLNARANQLARHLSQFGIGPESVVAVCLPGGVTAVAAMLAVLKAGGAYTLLDLASTQLPSADALVTQESLAKALPPHDVRVICVDTDAETIDGHPETDLDTEPDPRNLAYVAHESGVEVPHLVLTRAACGVPDSWAGAGTATVTLGAAGAVEIWQSLVRGAQAVLVPGGVPAAVDNAAVLSAVPLADLVETAPASLGGASHLVLTGEATQAQPVAAALEHHPGLRIHIAYGAAEAGTPVAGHDLPGSPDPDRTIPIGRPLPNTTMYVLDDELEPVPPGVPGTLYLGGLAVARGYRDDPVRTARRFIPDPFSGTPGSRLLRTGTRARHLSDGTVQLLARPTAPARDEPAQAQAQVRAAAEAEQTLAQIWADVLDLDLEQVTVDDNFFQLGGDSIMCIQVVARAGRGGLTITPKDFYTTSTLAELAAAARPATDAVIGTVWGEAPLTPIQHWYFDEITDERDQFAQGHFSDLAPDTDIALLEEALALVLRHHPTLGSTFRMAEGQWLQDIVEGPARIELPRTHAESAEPERWRETLTAVADELGRALDIETGDLVKAALVTGGPNGRRVLVFVVHHLVIDAVSWGILFQDLETAYQSLAAGRNPELVETTAWHTWTRVLHDYAREPALHDQLGFWCDQLADCEVPVDAPEPVPAATETVTTTLDTDVTAALLRQVPAVYGTQINDILLAAFLRVTARWTGRPGICVHLEGHGREDLFDQVDISRTVGWFTSMFPVRLTAPTGAGTRELILAAKESLRAVPQRGFGYGALRYCADPGIRSRFAGLPTPVIRFNYVGRPGALLAGQTLRPAPDRHLLPAAPNRRSRSDGVHQLEINAGIGRDRFGAQWTFNPYRHHRETVQRLADDYAAALREIVDHCSAATPERSARDLPLSGLGDSDVAKLMDRLRRRGE
ncbi:MULTISPECIES: condensation domain-containing protein [unclassified Streptomyces]|uniref:condensation domain-containing protein n=1 Tax=unclassified Streptomyces TaxID=2593676 RepID=UPI0036E27F58